MSLYVLGIIVSCAIIGAVSASVGVYPVLQKKSLVADAISHSLLPGVVLGYMVLGEKNPYLLALGATLTGLLGAYCIDFLVNKKGIKTDSAIGISLTCFFGFGVILLTWVQNHYGASQSGLEGFLLGNAASMQQKDLQFFTALGLLLALCTYLFEKEFGLITFNREYASSIGLPVKSLDFIMRLLVVLTIVAGVQAVGVVLMASCLIAPCVSAGYWSSRLRSIKTISLGIGALCGALGTLISFYHGSLPTGPVIVVCLSVVALLSVFFGNNRGLWQKIYKQKQARKKIEEEHLLKSLFHLFEKNNSPSVLHFKEISNHSPFSNTTLNKILNRLNNKGLLLYKNQDIKLLESGLNAAKRVVRLHRLWELYLLQRLNLPADHVHENAEQIEHVITPAIEAKLLKDLNDPEFDPHQSIIPR